MSSSSSKPAAPPPLNQELQLVSININHANLQNGNQTVTFRQMLHYWWGIIINVYQGNHNIITSPTPPQMWYPLVTPMRIIWFCLSNISFFLACGFFMETQHYKSYVGGGGHHHARSLLLFVAATGHTIWLIFLMFFSFCSASYERYRHHYLLKSLGEIIVLVFTSFLIMGIGHKHQEEYAAAAVAATPMSSLNDGKVGYSEVAVLLTCVFLTIDALFIINLLKPGHHYSLFEAIVTLTLHLGLTGEVYLMIPAVVFVSVIIFIKNFLWRRTVTTSHY